MTFSNISYAMNVVYTYFLYNSPLGAISASVSTRGLVRVEWAEDREHPREIATPAARPQDRRLAESATQQISEYLLGKRRDFDLPIDWSILTPFQQQALQAVMEVPYGQVRTYAEIAALIGKPRACRAVGAANGANPMPLVIPCHRLIGADGKLHGYGGRGGLATKAWLLKMEGCPLVF
jgi:methylated-DNA-[protein]-cysteine S-methyltransferase